MAQSGQRGRFCPPRYGYGVVFVLIRRLARIGATHRMDCNGTGGGPPLSQSGSFWLARGVTATIGKRQW